MGCGTQLLGHKLEWGNVWAKLSGDEMFGVFGRLSRHGNAQGRCLGNSCGNVWIHTLIILSYTSVCQLLNRRMLQLDCLHESKV